MLRALLGEQTQPLQRANHQALEEGFYESARDVGGEPGTDRSQDITEQKVLFQQLSNRCCMLEERLQRLEEGDSGAVNGSTAMSQRRRRMETRRGAIKWLLAKLWTRHRSSL